MPASKAQQKAVSKYMKENYDEIKIRIPKGQKEKIQAYAKAQNQSVNAFIWEAIQKIIFTIQDISSCAINFMNIST